MTSQLSRLPEGPLRKGAEFVVRRLQEAGFVAYWAGGCVRDIVLGRAPKDYDVATSARPEEVLERFPRAVAVGKAFGVVRVRAGGHEYEVATFRRDHPYHDGRHPSGVSFSGEQEDARRRDFTVNAMFYDPVTGEVRDHVGGRSDLEAGIIRAVGDPAARFAEDHLRLLRAVRFAATLGFRLDPATEEAIRSHADSVALVSAERIRDELTRLLLESARAGDAVVQLESLGLLRVILPEVVALKGQAQPPQYHPEGDVFQHTVLMLDLMEERSQRLAYAALLHDIGKPPTATTGGDRIRFHGHAREGESMTRAILSRLRFPNAEIDFVARCVANHMHFMEVQRMRPATLRRLIGSPTFEVELELHRLDCLASHRNLDNHAFLVQFVEQLRREPALPRPWVTGDDLLAMGIEPGPEIGQWHRRAYEAQLDGLQPDRTALLAWLREQVHP